VHRLPPGTVKKLAELKEILTRGDEPSHRRAIEVNMKLAGFTLVSVGVFTGNMLAQAPTVSGLVNNYSFTLPGLPNYGIAQGSIFAIFGTNLATQTTSLQSAPLHTTLAGVTITVSVNGTTVNPWIYYVSPTQISAVLPSSTPVGTGRIAVTGPTGTSAAVPLQVVQSAPGLLTAGNGTGPVSGFNANNQFAMLGFSAAANPGDVLELWGTGLGPVKGDVPLTAVSAPVEVDIGGMPANVLYAGRSAFLGLDQINVSVPAGVSGCNVSVVVVIGSFVSNFGTLAVTGFGRSCVDTNSPITQSILNDIAKTGSFTAGYITITQTTRPTSIVAGAPVGGTTDSGSAQFFRMTGGQLDTGNYAELVGGVLRSAIAPCTPTARPIPARGRRRRMSH
jgi:uncharacterized protein (TIGR03437 family)